MRVVGNSYEYRFERQGNNRDRWDRRNRPACNRHGYFCWRNVEGRAMDSKLIWGDAVIKRQREEIQFLNGRVAALDEENQMLRKLLKDWQTGQRQYHGKEIQTR